MKAVRILVVIAICALVTSQARAAVIAQWNLDSGTAASSTATGISSDTIAFAASGGSSVARQSSGGNPNGYELFTAAKPDDLNGATFTITLQVTAGYSFSLTSLTFDYETSSGNAPSSIAWTYSTSASNPGNGTSASLSNTGGAWTAASDALGITMNNSGTTYTITGTLGAGHGADIGFDNFTINGTLTAVPEPIAYALPLFGLIFIGGTTGRFWLGRQKTEGRI